MFKITLLLPSQYGIYLKRENIIRRTFTIITWQTAELFIILLSSFQTIEMQFNLEIKTNDAQNAQK